MTVALTDWETFVGTNTPVVGATVEAIVAATSHPNAGAVVSSTVTGSNGQWSFAALADNTYDIKISYNGRTKWRKGLSKFPNAITGASFATQVANRLLAGPTTGADATPTFRALVGADFPANTTPLASLINNAGSNKVIGSAAAGAWVETALTTAFLPVIHQVSVSIGVLADPTFTSTGFLGIEGDFGGGSLATSLTLTAGSSVIAIATVSGSHGTSGEFMYLRLHDSVSTTTKGEVAVKTAAANQLLNLVTIGYWTGLAAGAHTFTVQGRVDAGTATWSGTRRHLIVLEIKK
jgi:hypothetical protein